MIVKYNYYLRDDPEPYYIEIVLNPILDSELIDFIKLHNIQPGEFIEAKP